MRSVLVKDRQNLMDFTIEHYGSPAALIDVCLDNNLETDDVIYAGMYLLVQDDYPETAESAFAEYMLQNQISVVSINELDESEALGTNDGEFLTTNDDNYLSA